MPHKNPEERKAYRRRYYLENKEEIKRKKKEYNKRHGEKIKKVIYDHLMANPCVDCGETDPIVLQFDHVRGEKEFTISESVGNRNHYPVNRVKEEISKCDVRCSNCHIRRHAKGQDFWIVKMKKKMRTKNREHKIDITKE